VQGPSRDTCRVKCPLAGTSLAMIEKHYGHLLHDHAAKAMAGLAL